MRLDKLIRFRVSRIKIQPSMYIKDKDIHGLTGRGSFWTFWVDHDII